MQTEFSLYVFLTYVSVSFPWTTVFSHICCNHADGFFFSFLLDEPENIYLINKNVCLVKYFYFINYYEFFLLHSLNTQKGGPRICHLEHNNNMSNWYSVHFLSFWTCCIQPFPSKRLYEWEWNCSYSPVYKTACYKK